MVFNSVSQTCLVMELFYLGGLLFLSLQTLRKRGADGLAGRDLGIRSASASTRFIAAVSPARPLGASSQNKGLWTSGGL